MTTPRRRTIVLIVMLTALSAIAILQRHRTTGTFDIPSIADARTAQARFTGLLSGAGAPLPPGLMQARVEGRDERILKEGADDCRGRGIYRLNDAIGAVPLAIVAPHDGADRHTGEIARLLFEETAASAAAWNSAPRRPGPDCPGGGDPTRVDTHYLTAFSLAFAKRHPQGRIVQVHGFDGELRTSRAAQLADMIVSDGSRYPSPRLLDLADCLSASMVPSRVVVFPLETAELGATVNRQGRALRDEGFTGFAHIEMSAAFRERLLAEPDLRAELSRCLTSGLR